MRAISLNSNVHRDENNNAIGDPTETALNEFAFVKGFIRKEIEKVFPRIAEITFDSERKCMTTIHRSGDKYLIIVEGAIEVLMNKMADDSYFIQ